ncbi:MAG: hypothetical protein AAFX99_26740 [Myxococcota bacterium]
MKPDLSQWVGKLLPTCYEAMRLAEKGAEEPLSLSERLQLRYNSRLCLHCNCSERKFQQAMEKMRAAEAARRR